MSTSAPVIREYDIPERKPIPVRIEEWKVKEREPVVVR